MLNVPKLKLKCFMSFSDFNLHIPISWFFYINYVVSENVMLT